ncbi:MAG: hypothetical protein AAGE38_01685 [Pseudomonadota bacterium]
MGTIETWLEHIVSLAMWAKISVVAGILLIIVAFIFGRGAEHELSVDQKNSSGDFELTIELPAPGARLPAPNFEVSGRLLKPKADHRYWLMTANDFDSKYWPQEELILDDNGSFRAEASWPVRDDIDSDTATIVVLAVPKEALKLLDARFALPREQRTPFMDPEAFKEAGAIVLEKRSVVVTP